MNASLSHRRLALAASLVDNADGIGMSNLEAHFAACSIRQVEINVNVKVKLTTFPFAWLVAPSIVEFLRA